MFILKCIIVGIAWAILDWLFDLCERKLPPKLWEGIRWILVPVAAVAGMLFATWFWEGGVLWPFFAWPGFVLGAAFMAPRWSFIVGVLALLFAGLMAFQHGADAWDHSQTRRWLADIAGIAVAIGGLIWIKKQ